MPIQLICPGCSKQFRVADEHAGKKVKCPACKTVFEVPRPPQESPLPYVAPLPTTLAEDPSAPAGATSVGQQAMHRPNPYAAPQPGATTAYSPPPSYMPPSYAPPPPATSTPEQTMGNVGLALGIVALVGEFFSVFFLCCCGVFAVFGPALMVIPSGIGLALSMKSTGGLRLAGIIINAIALVISVVAIVLLVVVFVLYGSLMAFSLSQQPGAGGGF